MMHDPVYTVLEVDYPHPLISDFAGTLMTQKDSCIVTCNSQSLFTSGI
jgi:hypothetical protein